MKYMSDWVSSRAYTILSARYYWCDNQTGKTMVLFAKSLLRLRWRTLVVWELTAVLSSDLFGFTLTWSDWFLSPCSRMECRFLHTVHTLLRHSFDLWPCLRHPKHRPLSLIKTFDPQGSLLQRIHSFQVVRLFTQHIELRAWLTIRLLLEGSVCWHTSGQRPCTSLWLSFVMSFFLQTVDGCHWVKSDVDFLLYKGGECFERWVALTPFLPITNGTSPSEEQPLW